MFQSSCYLILGGMGVHWLWYGEEYICYDGQVNYLT
jgi:hypothetical protein